MSEAWHRSIWLQGRGTPRWYSCCCAKELSFTGKLKHMCVLRKHALYHHLRTALQWLQFTGYKPVYSFYTCHHLLLAEHVLFTVITRAGLVCTTLHLQDTHKVWTFSCQPIPNYWIKQMRMGYELLLFHYFSTIQIHNKFYTYLCWQLWDNRLVFAVRE